MKGVMRMLKRTPIFPLYEKYGAKTIDFGGWEMPVQFSKIQEEHRAVRQAAGLFDVSHMGEVAVRGSGARRFLQYLVTNDVGRLHPGKAQYTVMCDENGGTVEDFLIYMLAEDDYLLVINAANIEKDVDWIRRHAPSDVTVENVSFETGQLALQGPKAEEILQMLTDEPLGRLSPFSFASDIRVYGVQALVSRTGYTGEDGFEIYGKPEDVRTLWEAILECGKPYGLLPCGLGARDTLRLEARLPLYGQELSREISPLEAGLAFAVKLEKESDFIGKEALISQKRNGPPRRLRGLEMIDKGIPRNGYDVYREGKKIGYITSGTQSPTLKKSIGLALIESEFATIGEEVEVDIRGKHRRAKLVKTPFYQRKK